MYACSNSETIDGRNPPEERHERHGIANKEFIKRIEGVHHA